MTSSHKSTTWSSSLTHSGCFDCVTLYPRQTLAHIEDFPMLAVCCISLTKSLTSSNLNRAYNRHGELSSRRSIGTCVREMCGRDDKLSITNFVTCGAIDLRVTGIDILEGLGLERVTERDGDLSSESIMLYHDTAKLRRNLICGVRTVTWSVERSCKAPCTCSAPWL